MMDYFGSKRYLDTLPDWETGRAHVEPEENYLPRVRALLARLGDPQTRIRSLIVGGTNGKGTVCSLLDEIARSSGLRVGLYLSPHLHTQRERIRVNGALLDKDKWAVAVTQFRDATIDFSSENLGQFTKFEALTTLAVHMMADAQVDWGIFEVGLGGRYDATNAWDSEVAVLTRIGLDHVDILGETEIEIAADKLHIARSGRSLFTTVAQSHEVTNFLHDSCEDRNINLRFVDPICCSGRPSCYGENAALAQSVAESLELCSNKDNILKIIEKHVWPGRFEWANKNPKVLLDGAHNPQAIAALLPELKKLSSKSIIIVGIGKGHDARGIIDMLNLFSGRVLLTSSDHPKSYSAQDLASFVPYGMEIEILPTWREAIERGLELAASGELLCITGSLHLVARAREYFNLPFESDSITEDMALENLACIKIACKNLGMRVIPYGGDGTLLRLESGKKFHFFWRNKHPFNDHMSARIAEDKGFQYEMFFKDGLPTPQTTIVFNPLADSRFDRYKKHLSIDEIVIDVSETIKFPMVIKKARSSLAQGVYLIQNSKELTERLHDIFEYSSYTDNVVVIQEFLSGTEYRVLATDNQLLLVYRKESRNHNGSDLNPLHQVDGCAVPLCDGELRDSIAKLVNRISLTIELGFYAIDLICNSEGLYILELNANPMCHYYNKSNGRADFVSIYQKLFKKFLT